MESNSVAAASNHEPAMLPNFSNLDSLVGVRFSKVDIAQNPDDNPGNSTVTLNFSSGLNESEDEDCEADQFDTLDHLEPVSNPALAVRKTLTLNIDPFPSKILSLIDVTHGWKVAEKEGQLTVPITAQYKAIWNDAPIYIEEKSHIWCGAEYGRSTAWLTFKRLGVFQTPIKEPLQGQEKVGNTVEQYVASLVSSGDNHVTLLTAAYCVLFDRLWWYFTFSYVPNFQRSRQRHKRTNAWITS